MSALRVESDENAAKVKELQTKVKELEQDNLSKEQEITSLSHKNSLLEKEVEKLETGIKEAKAAADESSQHGSQNEALQRKLQKLEEEAEEADKSLRDTNDKYVVIFLLPTLHLLIRKHTPAVSMLISPSDCVRQTSRLATLSARSMRSKRLVISGRPSMKRWPRSMPRRKRSSTTLFPRLATSSRKFVMLHGFERIACSASLQRHR